MNHCLENKNSKSLYIISFKKLFKIFKKANEYIRKQTKST